MAITREVFEAQCKRRFGNANPERQRFEHWERMVRTGIDPYLVRTSFGLEPNSRCVDGICGEPDPDWCFKRFGMSRTRMADGRLICIAGEHEDYYDPDFCIYNDVIVLRPSAAEKAVTETSGDVEVYGYPAVVFPPTDFHSATLVGGRIYIVGRLGYQNARVPGTTPVYALDCQTYRVEAVATRGVCPGWIYKHHASYSAADHAVTVRGGMIVRNVEEAGEVNSAVFRLDLAAGVWERIAERERVRRYVIEMREDRMSPELSSEEFRPAQVPHLWLGEEEHATTIRQIDVAGVRVSFEEWVREVRVIVEGELADEVESRVLEEVRGNLERKTGSVWDVREVEGFD